MRFSKVEEKEFTGETNQKIRKMAFPCIKNRGKDLDIQNLETLLGMLEKNKKKHTHRQQISPYPWEPQPRRVFVTRVGSGRERKYSAFWAEGPVGGKPT